MQQASAEADAERKEREKQEESQLEKKEAERLKKIREMKVAKKCANALWKKKVDVVCGFFPILDTFRNLSLRAPPLPLLKRSACSAVPHINEHSI